MRFYLGLFFSIEGLRDGGVGLIIGFLALFWEPVPGQWEYGVEVRVWSNGVFRILFALRIQSLRDGFKTIMLIH